MNDQAKWEQAVVAIGNRYAATPPDIAAELDRLIEQIMRLKQHLVELALSAGSADICRTCAGECCRFGKYHVSELDVMAYLKTGDALVAPDFSSHPYCPYSDASGCTMPPGYRPMTCVVFNCQQIEDQLTDSQKKNLHGCEQELRDAIARAGHITGMRLDRALLLGCS